MPYDLVEYPFASGLDEGTDPRRTPKFLAVNNYVWTKKGRLEKRSGYELVSSTIAGSAQGRTVVSAAVTSGGTGYPNTGFWIAIGGGGAEASGIFSATAGVITSMTVVQGGYGYTSTPSINFDPFGAGGTGAVGTLTLSSAPTPMSLSGSVSVRSTPQGLLQVCDGQNVYSQTSQGWTPIGSLQNLDVSVSPFPVQIQVGDNEGNIQPNAQPFDVSLVRIGQYNVWGYGTGNFTVQDSVTGAIIPTNDGVQLGGGAIGQTVPNPTQVVTDGVRYVWSISAASGAGYTVFFGALDFGTSALPHYIDNGVGEFPDPITPTQISARVFDCAWDGTNSRLVFVYTTASARNILVFQTYTFSPVTYKWTIGGNRTVNLGAGATVEQIGVNVGANGATYYVAAIYNVGSFGGTERVAAYTWNGIGGVTGPTNPIWQQADPFTAAGATQVNIAILESPGGFHVVWTGLAPGYDNTPAAATSPINTLYSIFCNNSVGVSEVRSFATTLMTKPWLVNGIPYALCLANAGLAYVIMNLDATQGDPVPTIGNPDLTRKTASAIAIINPRIAMQSTDDYFDLVRNIHSKTAPTTVVQISATEFQMPVTFAPEPGESALLALQTCTVTFGSTINPPVNEWTGLLYPSGIPSIAGEATVRPVQFLAPPVIVEAGTGAAAPPGLPTGTYTYVATYARVNEDGSITESPPSNAVDVVISAANTQGVIYVSSYSFAGRGDGNAVPGSSAATYILLYRSLNGEGDTLYRVATDPFTIFEGAAINDTVQPCQGIGDHAISDTVIAKNPQLYTNGNVFANVSPPSARFAARVRDRVYLAGTPDGFSVFYSDPVTNVGSANFHDEQIIITDDDGPVTGVVQLDANVMIFKDSAVYAVFGVEGNNTGNGNTLSPPTAIPTGGIGCIATGSIIETPQGIIFQSHRGLELMDRAFQLSFIGEAVKDETAGQTVVASVLLPEQYQVRFYLSTWVTLVLSTLTGEWSKFGYGNRPTSTMRDASVVNGVVYWCGNGFVMRETPGSYADNGAVIVPSFQTGWINLGQKIAGYQRFHAMQLLGTYFDRSSISVALASDYSTTPIQIAAWTDADILGIAGFDSNRLQLDVSPVNQRAEAISVVLLDSGPQDGTFNAGIAWDAFTFEVRALPGKYRNLPTGAKR